MAEEKKVVTDDKSAVVDYVALKAVDSNGNSMSFKIKRSTKLRKLMDEYCRRQGVQINGLRFLYDGNRLNPDNLDTPDTLGMENDDQIDVMIEQVGGFSA